MNIFVAGPSFHARFNPATHGDLDLRYYNTYAEETDGFNGDRYSAAARLHRLINSVSKASLACAPCSALVPGHAAWSCIAVAEVVEGAAELSK